MRSSLSKQLVWFAVSAAIANPVWATHLTTAFTYQGQLVKSGSAVEDTCTMTFGLWDTAIGGTQKGTSPQGPMPVVVTKGMFTIPDLNFGDLAFDGQCRWLEISVQCPGDVSATTLAPRQELTAAPYALALPGLYTQVDDISANLIGGYSGNAVTPGVAGATISGGGRSDDGDEYPDNNRVTYDYATVAGGHGNHAGGEGATVGGGEHNAASDHMTTVGGGANNTANFLYATVSGGRGNIASGHSAVVGGGWNNTADGSLCTVGGGEGNIARGGYNVVSGGYYNTASGPESAIGGGEYNIASGFNSTVPGGYSNHAGGDDSFAAGVQAKVRDATQSGDWNGDEGTFIWADSTNADFTSTGPNQFLIRASGGVGIGKNNPTELLDVDGNVKASGTIQSGGSITINGSSNTITSASGNLSFGSTNLATTGSVTAADVNGVTMGKIYLTTSGTIQTTRNGGNVLLWDELNGEIELTNTAGDWCDIWWQAQKGAVTSGGSTATWTGTSNVVIISGADMNDYGFEIHFGQADGQGGWASVWLQYANGALVGHYIKY
ncbi:MAG: hypothetical protein AABZ47_13405 [Planctomycetota bacterium]